tara:strand:- start:1239 stop:3398 length:2160 start_codon:yes stop_codon:yes gene_type:complete
MTDEIRAEPGSLSVGDMVTWNSSGGSASGKITRIATDGTLDVPDSSFSVTGTPDDPAALIRVYRSNEPSETIVGHKFSTLNKQRASAGVDKMRAVYTERMGELLQTRAQFIPSSVDTDSRSVEVTWTTGAPVLRRNVGGSYYEELSLGDAVNMERLNNGAPLLNSHKAADLSDIVGVVERAWTDEKEGRAVVRFSDRAEVEPIWRDVQQGIIRNISVGYSVDEFERVEAKREGEPHTLRATSWTPMELSLVPVPADFSATVRELERVQEPTETKEPTMDETREMEQAAPVEAVASAPDNTQVIEAAVKAERARAADIRTAVRAAGLEDSVAESMISDGVEVDAARKAVLDQLATRQAATPTVQHISVTEDASDKRAACLEAALEARVGLGEWTDAARSERSSTMLDMAKESLGRTGANITGLSKSELAYRAMHSTSDFPLLLSNIARKSLMAGYEAEQQTWRPLSRQRNLPDFRPVYEVQVNGQFLPEELAEGGEYKTATVSEAQTSWSLKSYAKKIRVTRNLVINDDLDFLGRIPQMIGRGYSLFESNQMWANLTGNPTMGEDSKALFHSDHDNSGTGAISVAALSDARFALRNQSDPAGNRVNLRARYMVIPTALETDAEQFLAPFTPAQTSDVNPFSGKLQIIAEPRLDDASSSVYYVTADPAQVDMMVYGYLAGEAGPQVTTVDERDPDGITILSRIDFGCAVLNHRGFYKSTGA